MISDPQNVGEFSLTAVIQPILFCTKDQLCVLQTSMVLVELLEVASDLTRISVLGDFPSSQLALINTHS